MTDFIPKNLSSLPIEIITLTVQNLTMAELARFKKVCRLFNNIGSDAKFLKPLYDRLYTLDKTLPAGLNPENASFEFKMAFEKVRDRQSQEMEYAACHIKNNQTKIHKDMTSSGKTIKQLEKKNALLNEWNISRIQDAINKQPGTQLDLYSCGLTRLIITKENTEYFNKLTILNCNHNQITSLNLQGCPALQALYCANNQITSLNLENCRKLRWLDCQNNQITNLNLQGCAALDSLYCSNNKIMSLNLEGASPAIQAKYSALEETLLFKQLGSTAFSERAKIIKSLGVRYTALNCLKHGCFYEAAMISYQAAPSAVYNGFWSAVNQGSSFLTSFSSRRVQNVEGLNETPEQKRKREEDNHTEDPKYKKPKPNGA